MNFINNLFSNESSNNFILLLTLISLFMLSIIALGYYLDNKKNKDNASYDIQSEIKSNGKNNINYKKLMNIGEIRNLSIANDEILLFSSNGYFVHYIYRRKKYRNTPRDNSLIIL